MAKKTTTTKTIKVKITAAVAGKFLLPYNIDQVVSMEEKQAQTLIDANCAVAVKK